MVYNFYWFKERFRLWDDPQCVIYEYFGTYS